MSALTKLENYAQRLTSDCHNSARSRFITCTETIFVFMYLLSVKVLKRVMSFYPCPMKIRVEYISHMHDWDGLND